MKLHSILNNNSKRLRLVACLFTSAIISGVTFAESSKDGFPPLSEAKKNSEDTTKIRSATSTLNKTPVPAARYQRQATPMQNRYYYPQTQTQGYYYPQQMQAYRNYPYRNYPQQQLPNYAPKQWAYPQQRFNATTYPRYQPYAQNWTQTAPYRPYPVTPYQNQQPYNYPQIPAQQTNNVVNTVASNTIGKKLYPMRKKIKKEKHAWGDERHIWPDFYTDFTGDLWDKMINAPFDAGRMPGGWRAPSLSTPDPATVGDAVANQLPPIAEEMENMTNFSN